MVASAAHAGGFALREQSAYYQGMSFAGYGTTSDSISSMFWNPASLMGAGEGLTVEAHNSIILPYSDIDGTFSGNGVTIPGSTAGSGDIASDAWIPASYAAYRLNDQLVFGLGINAPFGLTTKPDFSWAGQYYSRTSKVFSLNVNPTVTYQVNDMIAIAAGVQGQYIDVSLKTADPFSGGARTNEIKGDDISFGATAGITIKPWKGTEIGVGYRSAIGHNLDGDLILPSGVPTSGIAAGTYAIGLGMMTPDMVNISAKQSITDKIRVLGTIEWTNWSRLKSPRAELDSNGATITTLHFNYEDGWFFSLGGEYDFNEQLTLRAGLAYEISPIDEDIRSTRLPDNNRWWLSAGASYALNDHLAFDIGYSHLIPESTKIDIGPGHQDYNASLGTYKADVDSNVNIFSASLRYKF
jgi:long-chain fatty acid transport protein